MPRILMVSYFLWRIKFKWVIYILPFGMMRNWSVCGGFKDKPDKQTRKQQTCVATRCNPSPVLIHAVLIPSFPSFCLSWHTPLTYCLLLSPQSVSRKRRLTHAHAHVVLGEMNAATSHWRFKSFRSRSSSIINKNTTRYRSSTFIPRPEREGSHALMSSLSVSIALC